MKTENRRIIGIYVNQALSYCEKLVAAGECGESEVETIVDRLHNLNEELVKIKLDDKEPTQDG